MIDPWHIGFDIDGVVANTMQLFLDIGRELYGIEHIRLVDMTCYQLQECLDLAPETIDAIMSRILDGNYSCALAAMEGADRVLGRLGVYGPIQMVTARPAPGPIEPWMAQLLSPDRCPVSITATGSFEAKADILTAKRIHHFVEDRLDTCYLLQDQGITPVLFAQPWNRQDHPFMEVDGWSALEKLIDFS